MNETWFVCAAEGDLEGPIYAVPQDQAVEQAKRLAQNGTTARVYKLLETHYFEAYYQSKANI